MRFLLLAALYGAALPTATVADGTGNVDAAKALAADAVPKLAFLEPAPPTVTGFTTFEGEAMDLSAYDGDVVVLNFWATWCAPCRHEMPTLDALQQAMGGDGLEVVTMAFGRHSPVAMERFWAEAGVEALPLHRDPEGAMARALGVQGLPHTVILDADGQVVAELIGEADWSSEEMKGVLGALME